jgi:hypothetical protein
MWATFEDRSLTQRLDTCSDEPISLFPRLITNRLICQTLG